MADHNYFSNLIWQIADLLRGPYHLSMSNGIRTSQWRLEPERFLELGVLLPPLDGQRAIVAHIDSETTKLEALRVATERTLSLLKERRAALISAAVTGQIEIREAIA